MSPIGDLGAAIGELLAGLTRGWSKYAGLVGQFEFLEFNVEVVLLAV